MNAWWAVGLGGAVSGAILLVLGFIFNQSKEARDAATTATTGMVQLQDYNEKLRTGMHRLQDYVDKADIYMRSQNRRWNNARSEILDRFDVDIGEPAEPPPHVDLSELFDD